MLYEVFNSIWDFFPHFLYPEEITDPVKVIDDFFSYSSLPHHLSVLKTWRDCVLQDSSYAEEDDNPANLVFFYRFNLRLIEAAFLLKQVRRNRKQERTQAEINQQLLEEYGTWLYYPQHLNPQERADPVLVFEQLFETYGLPEYRAHLYEWLENGMSNEGADESTYANDIVAVYENLQKLYDASWVIYQREVHTFKKDLSK
jgi:hypothetical protein